MTGGETRAVRQLATAMVVVLTAYVAALTLPGLGIRPPWRGGVVDVVGVLGVAALLGPVLLVVRAAATRPAARSWLLPLATGFALFLGSTVLPHVEGPRGAPFPSPADLAHLASYPLLLAALLLGLGSHLRRVRLIVALDGLTGMLAGSALAAWAVVPLVEQGRDGDAASLMTLVYPAAAGVLVSATVGALGIVGLRCGPGFVTWALGLLLFAGGDIAHAYELALDTHQPGTPLDAAWAAGFSLVALGALHLRAPVDRTLPGARSLIVVSAAAAAAVGVLAAAPPWQENSLPSLLALLAVTACGVRFLLAFLQLRELAAIRELARTDELTGIPNRRALYTELDRLFAKPLPEDGDGFALALIDLDHFKEVNDSYGHAAGDDLLRAVVDRFSATLERLRTPYTFARLGGDEFAVLFPAAGSENAAMACAQALQESLEEPVLLEDLVLHVQASVGVATAPLHAENRADMLFAADAAMYAAKSSGEPICFHSPSAVGDRRRRLEIAEDLFKALERRELTVEYQPILEAGGEVVGAEALVRWDHPRRGRLLPGEFLDTAERYRLTPAIAERVLDVSLGDLARWQAAGRDLRLSVNVSASDLRDEGLVKLVASALLKHQVPPESLVVEITESAMMRDPELAQTVMVALHDLGVQLAVDDYGTGYSSLEYLLKLPINEIKLDRAFCRHVVTELRATAIVRSTIDLTHALGLRMVAEGVEDEGTLFILNELGCDLVQGWHFGRPMTARDFEAQLHRDDERPRSFLRSAHAAEGSGAND